ncbi:MAG: hypothetical protein AAGB22_13985, partial [Bacteroidota bacterium]
LYRLVDKANGDHLPSQMPNGEPPFVPDGTLGFPWLKDTAPAGTANLFRGGKDGRNVLMSELQPPDAFPGFVHQPFPGLYGYPRFLSNEISELYALEGSAITLRSNLMAGGAIWEWWYKGKQYISNTDYGREIQASIGGNLGVSALPTEGGDYVRSSIPGFFHGSPLQQRKNITNSNDGGITQITRAAPLEWELQKWNTGTYTPNLNNWQGDYNRPVAYTGWSIGKNVTLDDNTIDLGKDLNHLRPQIARYETVFTCPIALGEGAEIEMPTAYLSEDFNQFFWIDATVANLDSGLTQVTQFPKEAVPGVAKLGLTGGAVIATADHQHAMGVYGAPPPHGDVDIFTLWNFLDAGGTSKWSAAHKGLAKGENKFTAYIITGTLDEVRAAMRALYVKGYR